MASTETSIMASIMASIMNSIRTSVASIRTSMISLMASMHLSLKDIEKVNPKPRLLPGGLSSEQTATFHRDGYLVIPGALEPATVAALLAETHNLLENFSLEGHPMTTFATSNTSKHITDEYFLTSGDKIRFFFEEGAFDASGALTKPKSRAINKIGHSLHVLSQPFASLLTTSFPYSPGAIARTLGYRDPRCLQSIVICKQPEIGGAVRPHQDSAFLFTDPPSALGFWYALEDCTVENGCLSFLPGSHRTTGVKKRFAKKLDGTSAEFIDNTGTQFPEGKGPEKGVAQKEYRSADVKAGSLVLIHGNVMHKSEHNLSSKSRIIYTFHIIEADGAVFDERNWIQPPAGGFTKL